MSELSYINGVLEVRDLTRREVDVRLLAWGEIGEIRDGYESFARGAFAGADPSRIVFRNMHAAVVGRGLELRETEDGAYMTFRVSATPAGDELLTLAADGVLSGVSVGFFPVEGGSEVRSHNGRRHWVRNRVDLREASATFIPTFASGQVLSVRQTEETSMPNPNPEPTPDPTPDPIPTPAPAPNPPVPAPDMSLVTREVERVLAERERRNFQAPAPAGAASLELRSGEWMSVALRSMSGERISDLEVRALADLITTANLGMVPDAVLGELVDVIDPARPFMNSTRHLPTPDSGMNLVIPRIGTRPTVGLQATEKTAITSTVTSVTTADFPFETYAGGGDISIQLLRRSSPAFLSLYLELLAEAYALTTEAAAIADLIGAGMTAGGALDPEDAALGASWGNAQAAFKRPPDTIWFSSAAAARFIDAKDGGGRQLYAPLAAQNAVGAASVAAGVGPISGLRPVYTPALDATAVEVIIGPSRAFAWAEDGTFTLQADNPELLGRDVALAGMVAFAPFAPAAFTSYTLSVVV